MDQKDKQIADLQVALQTAIKVLNSIPNTQTPFGKTYTIIPDLDKALEASKQVPLAVEKLNENGPDEKLTPIGKMKGDVDGEFISFYIAADASGKYYKNGDPNFNDGWVKRNGWQVIDADEIKASMQTLYWMPANEKYKTLFDEPAKKELRPKMKL